MFDDWFYEESDIRTYARAIFWRASESGKVEILVAEMTDGSYTLLGGLQRKRPWESYYDLILRELGEETVLPYYEKRNLSLALLYFVMEFFVHWKYEQEPALDAVFVFRWEPAVWVDIPELNPDDEDFPLVDKLVWVGLDGLDIAQIRYPNQREAVEKVKEVIVNWREPFPSHQKEMPAES